MWWQYLVVGTVVAVALYFVARRVKRSLDPQAPACACGCGESCREGGKEFGQGPQSISDLDPTACSTCSSQDRPRTSNRG